MSVAAANAPLAEHSSSDFALRYRAPFCVANAWRLTATYIEEPGEKLKRRFALLDTALRYIVAVLGSEQVARALPPVKSWDELVGSLDGRRVSLGTWAQVARDLSVGILKGPRPICEPVARVLATGGPGGARASAACDAVSRLITLRNEEAHPDAPAASNAASALQESADDFRAFLTAFRSVGELPPWVVTRYRHGNGGGKIDVVCLRGVELLPARTIGVAAPVADERPFVVAEDGRILYLSPMLAWGAFKDRTGGRRPNELRLFQAWKKGPLYRDPLGMDEPSMLAPARGGGLSEWLADGAAVGEGVFAGRLESLRALRNPDASETAPVVPGYELGQQLGHGGNGRVYVGRREGVGEPVALKVLPSTVTADEAGQRRLRREYDAMKSVRHPNVARVFHFATDAEGAPVLVMELVEGENLRARIDREPMPVPVALRVLDGVLAGLACVHERGIVHRDVTPENVILQPSGAVKLIDFGIAFVADGERITRTLDGMGKQSFAAPEQINPSREPGPTADVYACGKLLGYLVSGASDVAAQHAALPGALQAIVRRATAEAPSERYPHARAFLDALAEARAAGWEGPPVRAGEQLSPEYAVAALRDPLGGGLWLLELTDLRGDACLGIVAEHRPDALARLRHALAGLSPTERAHLGDPDLRETKDGVSWCRLRTADIDALRRAFERATAGGAAGPGPLRDDTPSRRQSAAPLPSSALAPPHAERALTDRGRPRWTPPPPSKTGEDRFSWLLVPRGPLGLLSIFFVPAWPLLALHALRVVAGVRMPATVSEPRPRYLRELRPFGRIADPGEVARAMDDLALIVVAQRALRGVGPADAAKLREIYADPLHLAWEVLGLGPSAHVDEHRRVLAGSTTRIAGPAAVRTVHAALLGGAASIPPRAHRVVNKALLMLHRFAHAGAKGLPEDKVEAWLAERADTPSPEAA